MATYAPFVPQIRLYQNWLRDHRGLSFDSYDALWRWSITDLNAFCMRLQTHVEPVAPITAIWWW